MRNTLYPDDIFTNSTGQQLVGLGSDGKYTNGSVSPYTPPSRVPANQFNLTNDLLGNMIAGARLTPNNTDTMQLVNALRHLNRYMEWQPDVAYEYGDIVYVRLGGGLGIQRAYICQQNHTGVDPRTSGVEHWINEGVGTLIYRTSTPTPSTTGVIALAGGYIGDVPEYKRLRQYLGGDYLPDMRGRVARATGGDAPAVLATQEDAIQRMMGTFAVYAQVDAYSGIMNASGVFYGSGVGGVRLAAADSTFITNINQYASFDSSRQTRTASETRMKSMGWVACIVF